MGYKAPLHSAIGLCINPYPGLVNFKVGESASLLFSSCSLTKLRINLPILRATISS
jgi:hypothetical protein